MKILLVFFVILGLATCQTFTLSFDCAPNQGVGLQSSLANVIWNNVIILSIIPTDYSVISFSTQVTAVVGINTLQFQGAGYVDFQGLGLTNVALIKVGDTTNTNLLINGDFSQPNTGANTRYQFGIPGWGGTQLLMGPRYLFNSNWPVSSKQLLDLGGYNNNLITQNVTFNSAFNLIKTPLPNACSPFFYRYSVSHTITFNWAVTNVGTSNYATSQGNVIWYNSNLRINPIVYSLSLGASQFSVYPVGNLTNTAIIYVTTNPCGYNYLQFDGTQQGDGFGVTISNIKITNYYTGVSVPLSGIWIADKPKFAPCSTFNNLWDPADGALQCFTLDSGTNQRYTQLVNIPYTPPKIFDYAGSLNLSAFKCLASKGYTFATLRADTDTVGVISPTIIQTMKNAVTAGVVSHVYLTLCPSADPNTQVRSILTPIQNNGLYLFGIWLKIIKNTNPQCQWSTNQTKNCQFLQAVINYLPRASTGIYTTRNLWNSYFGNTCSYGSVNDGVSLWYTTYLPGGKIDSTQSFNDFVTYGGFGGWTQPVLKQIAVNVTITCSNPNFKLTINNDWHL